MVVAGVVLTAFFLYVILGATDTRAPRGFAPLVGGLIAGATYALLIGKVAEAVPLPETTEA